MIRQHGVAVSALLEADPSLTVFAKRVPNLTNPPYVRLYVSIDQETYEGLCGTTDTARVRLTTHSVGPNDDGAWIVQDRVRARLLDVAPTVAGWLCSRIRHDTGVPPDRDESTGREVIDAIDVWTYTATPA